MKKSDLVQLVVERAGIPEDKAETAVNVVLQQLKTRLPAPVGGQIDSLLQGGEGKSGGSDLGDMAKRAGGMFDK